MGWAKDAVRAVESDSAALAVIGACGATDGQLRRSLAAVRAKRWRELTTWPGSSLTIARTGTTWAVIGDLATQHPVYWRMLEGRAWWGTSAIALAALDDAPVDPLALAARLAFGQPDVLADRSLFREVRRVPGGHLLLIEDGVPRTDRYEPTEYDPVSLPDGAPAVRAALSLAVAARIDGRPVSADLAGVDSTTLACLAAQHTTIRAITHTHTLLRNDDIDYAHRTAAAVGLNHRVVEGDDRTLYYSGLNDLPGLPATDAPTAYTVTARMKRANLTAIPAGAVHFAGTAGDTVLSAPGAYIADLLRRRAYRTALSHAQARARVAHTSLWTILGRARPSSRLTLAGCWRQHAAELRRPAPPWAHNPQASYIWTPKLATADWMTGAARNALAQALDDAADHTDDHPAQLVTWLDRQDITSLGTDIAGWQALAHPHGVELAHPYLENEVIRACLSVPPEQRATPGTYKPLVAAAFPNGPVPDFVLQRRTKGIFNGVSHAGLQRNAATISHLLGPASRLGALGLITPEPVADVIRRSLAGQRAPHGSLHLAVATEVWLRQLEQHTDWWEARHVAAA